MKIVAFPKGENPYQRRLYENIENLSQGIQIYQMKGIDTSNRVEFLKDIFQFPIILNREKEEFSIFHLHWQNFYFPILGKTRFLPSIILLMWCLFWIKIFHYKLVWTMHDYYPHERVPKLDEAVLEILLKSSAKIIVLNSDTKEILMTAHQVKQERIITIPHGNFIGEYNGKTILHEEFVFGFFGMIKPYKGLKKLIEAFSKIKKSNIQLKISGQAEDKAYFKQLADLAKSDSRIILMDKHLSASELADQAISSNIIVLPFLEITNSGSALTAFSLKKSIIAPLIGSIKDFPSSTGIYYDPEKKDSLLNSLKFALENADKISSMEANAYNYAKSLSWESIARKTVDVYNAALSD